jgi:hypothetical protein
MSRLLLVDDCDVGLRARKTLDYAWFKHGSGQLPMSAMRPYYGPRSPKKRAAATNPTDNQMGPRTEHSTVVEPIIQIKPAPKSVAQRRRERAKRSKARATTVTDQS